MKVPEDMLDYHGQGFPLPGARAQDELQGGLSYFPFSVGPRACPAKNIVVATLQAVLLTVSGSPTGFRLDFDGRHPPNDQGIARHLDPGQSHAFTIIPQLESSVRVLVTRGGVGGDVVATAPAVTNTADRETGWAQE
jgi:hypothetical protein